MLGLFKSDFSIGKSILNLNLPKETEGDSSDSIFEIALENNLKEIILVEDSLTGFLQALKNSNELGIKLVFGLRISVCNNLNTDKKENVDESKVVIFARNDNGCKILNKIYSFANTQGNGRIDYKNLESFFCEDLILSIPFYDSFIFNNSLFFKSCIPNFSFCKPQFFIESNNLPFDSIIKAKVEKYCLKNNYDYFPAKSIYYKNKEDFKAFQTYKCICNRSFGKARSLNVPNLDHCGSDEFSFESYLEKCDT